MGARENSTKNLTCLNEPSFMKQRVGFMATAIAHGSMPHSAERSTVSWACIFLH